MSPAAVQSFAVMRRVGPPILTVAGLLFGVLLISEMGLRTDAQLYHSIDLVRPYSGLAGEDGAFLYSPAFAQVIQPLRLLPVDIFVTAWRLVELAILVLLAGPFTLPLLLTVPVTGELMEAQVHLILVGAIIAAWRWPGLWAVPILTKPTLGVGLLFYVGRGDWRALWLALLATAAISLASFTLAPNLWLDWVRLLIGSAGLEVNGPAIPVPLPIRLIAAAGLALYAGRRNLPRLVPIAAMVALPTLWVVGLSMAVAALADVEGLRARRRQSAPALDGEPALVLAAERSS